MKYTEKPKISLNCLIQSPIQPLTKKREGSRAFDLFSSEKSSFRDIALNFSRRCNFQICFVAKFEIGRLLEAGLPMCVFGHGSSRVLVDVYADPNLLVAYVPEENLLTPEKPDKERFDHPYISFLYFGMDTAGDFIPIKQLREKYNKPRYEVPTDSQDEDDKKDS